MCCEHIISGRFTSSSGGTRKKEGPKSDSRALRVFPRGHADRHKTIRLYCHTRIPASRGCMPGPRSSPIALAGITCRWCDSVFALCRSCFRGQAYCCELCRKSARREQCHRAQRKYLDNRDGRRQAADVAAAYRERLRNGAVARKLPEQIVIDQGSPRAAFSAEILLRLTRCARCGRRGRVVRWL